MVRCSQVNRSTTSSTARYQRGHSVGSAVGALAAGARIASVAKIIRKADRGDVPRVSVAETTFPSLSYRLYVQAVESCQ